jgi:hypothetical protein
MKLLFVQFLPFSSHFIPLWSKYSPQYPVLINLSLCTLFSQCVRSSFTPIQNKWQYYVFLYFSLYLHRQRSPVSTIGRPGDRGSIPGRGERIFPLTSVSRPSPWLIQPPVQWVPGVLSPVVKRDWGVTLTTHPHLVSRS